jgi:hypothetical protein
MADILSVKPTNTPQDIRIETTILEPQNISQTHATFLFNNTGILDKHTRIIVPVKCDNTSILSENQFFLSAGAFGLIRTATLKYQGNDIAQTDEVGLYNSMKRMFRPQNYRNKVEAVKVGSSFAFRNTTDKQYQKDIVADNFADVDTGKVALMNSKYFRGDDCYHLVNDDGLGIAYAGLNINPRYAIQDETANTFHAIFSLEDLFPEFLGNVMLPLYLLDNQLSLEIAFSAQPDRTQNINAGLGALAPITIDTENVNMVMDLIYYSDRTMSALEARSKGQGIPMIYGDLINIRQTLQNNPADVPAPVAGELSSHKKSFSIDIGLDNLVVRSMLMALENTEVDAVGSRFCGKYSSNAPRVNRKGDMELQLTINNVPLYPNPVDMNNKLYDQTQQVFAGTPLQVPRPLWDYNGSVFDEYAITQLQALTTPPNPVPTVGELWRSEIGAGLRTNSYLNWVREAGLYSGSNTAGSFLGNQYYLGVNLAKTYENVRGAGVRIGNTPIRLAINYTFVKALDAILGDDFSAGSRNLSVFCNVERSMMIKNGGIMVSEN